MNGSPALSILPTAVLCWAALSASPAFGQTGSPAFGQTGAGIDGRVVSADSVALVGAGVFVLPGGRIGAVTDESGRFSLTVFALPVEIEVRSVGYAPSRIRVARPGPVVVVMHVEDAGLGEVEVRAGRTRTLSDVQGSAIAIRSADIRETPQVLGEPDLLKTLQLLPGVRGGAEGQSGLYVRGGGPDENLVLIDGLPLYGTSHLFGFASAFPSEVVGEAEIQKGGFASRHAGRLSSVLDVRARTGEARRSARVHVGLLAAQATAEGAVPGGTVLVGGRRTFVDLATRAFASPSNSLHPAFADGYARYDAALSRSARLAVSGYASRDRYVAHRESAADESDTEDVGIEDVSVGWSNGAAGARLVVDRGSRLRAEVGVGAVRFEQGSEQQTSTLLPGGRPVAVAQDRFQTGVRDVRGWLHVERGAAPGLTLSGGAVATRHRFTSENGPGGSARPGQGAFEGGLYAEAEGDIGRVRASAGAHGALYTMGGQAWASAQPRVRVRYLAGNTAVRASYARTVQPVHGVVNTVDGLPVEAWLPATAAAPPSQAGQWAVGVERQRAGSSVGWSAEAYVKRSSGILARREGVARVGVGGDWEADVARGRATSVGVEVFVEKRAGRWTGWLGYTLARTTQAFAEIDDGRPFPSRFDRRHDVSVVGRYRLGPRTSLAATWVYGTGDAVTLATGLYAVCADPRSTGAESCPAVVAVGPRNGSRLPAYHRLDLAYRFERASGRAAFSAGVYNAYARQNPFRVDLVAGFENVGEDLVLADDRLDASVLLPFVPYVHYEVRL